jgi:hypothetical protein
MNYYSDRKRKRNYFNLGNSIYSQRVDDSLTKPFKEMLFLLAEQMNYERVKKVFADKLGRIITE